MLVASTKSLPFLPSISQTPRMTSNPLCAACRQMFRVRCHRTGRSSELYRAHHTPSIRNTPRLFSTNRSLSASQVPPKVSRQTPLEYQPKPPPAKVTTKEDPNAPAPSQGKESDTPSSDTSSRSTPTNTLGKELRRRLPTDFTETYVVYGVCDTLVKECARQADYTVPQVRQKGVEVPKTKDQEDLGVGTGWWYESERHIPLNFCHPLPPQNPSELDLSY